MTTPSSASPATNADTTPAAPAGTTPTAGAGAADTAAAAPVRKPPKPPIRKPNTNLNPRPPRALFCLKLDNPVRKYSIQLVEYKYPLILVHCSNVFLYFVSSFRLFSCKCCHVISVLLNLFFLYKLLAKFAEVVIIIFFCKITVGFNKFFRFFSDTKFILSMQVCGL